MICGTAVFVCLVCGGEEPDDRFILRFHAQEVVKFISNCGDDNLMFLLHPPRLKKALYFLDTDQSGEIDKEEWRVTRRPPHVFPSFVARL